MSKNIHKDMSLCVKNNQAKFSDYHNYFKTDISFFSPTLNRMARAYNFGCKYSLIENRDFKFLT